MQLTIILIRMHPANLMRDFSLGNAPTDRLLRFSSLLILSTTFVVRIFFQCVFEGMLKLSMAAFDAHESPAISLNEFDCISDPHRQSKASELILLIAAPCIVDQQIQPTLLLIFHTRKERLYLSVHGVIAAHSDAMATQRRDSFCSLLYAALHIFRSAAPQAAACDINRGSRLAQHQGYAPAIPRLAPVTTATLPFKSGILKALVVICSQCHDFDLIIIL